MLQEQPGWSGDTFEIRDINGRTCFIMKGKAMSFSQRKTLLDLQGIPIVNFRKEFSLWKKYLIYAGAEDRQLLATIKAHTFGGISAEIDFTNVDGQPRSFALQGNFFASRADIIDRQTGAVVARISRQRWNTNEFVWGKQTYSVTIAPNVDLALMICICVALDEAKHDNKNSGLLG